MAMWSHSGWKAWLTSDAGSPAGLSPSQERLAAYARCFDTVEGNTTFYALPAAHTVSSWNLATPEDFRFTFKLPSRITHELALGNCRDEVNQFFHLMEPVMAKTALWKIQLPARFGPESLPLLAEFIDNLPRGLGIGVEVRHRAFFAKGEAEQALNRLLMEHGVNRIIMDTRPVFALPPSSDAIIDAHNKKPRVPVHAIATAAMPVVRFIGQPVGMIGANEEIKDNRAFFEPWIGKLIQWLEEGRSPYLFIHTPDNSDAPELARLLLAELRQVATQQGLVCQLPDLEAGLAAPPQLGLW